jgi:hypothetical protein
MAFTLGGLFPKKPINEAGLDLNDPFWKELEGGYKGVTCDASVLLKQLENAHTLQSADVIYQKLWDELHHQGDVGLASYYAVPHLVRIAQEKQLVDYNVLGLVSMIAIQRHKNNPILPKALTPAFNNAIVNLADLAKLVMNKDWDLSLSSSALAAIALSKGQLKLASAIFILDSEDVLDEVLDLY